jgi:hypothetical protein
VFTVKNVLILLIGGNLMSAVGIPMINEVKADQQIIKLAYM